MKKNQVNTVIFLTQHSSLLGQAPLPTDKFSIATLTAFACVRLSWWSSVIGGLTL
jgi:hypothetical protein